ncbi:MAG: phosphoribosyltransferase [Bernardetiaceae bacterium]|nr:phosphoribosyltransferase [Bernardetiaceae bacterium]
MVENKILNHVQTERKIRRIAFEIYENHYDEEHIILAGIDGMGYRLAEILLTELKTIGKQKYQLIKVSLDKLQPTQSEVKLDVSLDVLKNQSIVLIDDVLNTGRTLAYSLKPFLSVRIRRLSTAVLVDRSHSNFPISANFAGYRLSTTLNEHVRVQLDSTQYAVYLD